MAFQKTLKVVLITNIPTPYRVPVFNQLAIHDNIELTVFYMSENESNRSWKLPDLKHKQVFLQKSKTIPKSDGFNYIHLNKGVWALLNEANPDIIITGGFNPTQLQGWLWAKLKGRKHIAWSDGWKGSERELSLVHRVLRTLVFRTSHAFVGASKNTWIMLKDRYGAKQEQLFMSPHCADNERFLSIRKPFNERKYHLIFSGTMTERKNPIFMARVLGKLKEHVPGLHVAFLGKGELMKELRTELDRSGVSHDLLGHVAQADIPELMASSKVHVFPTLLDAWGVVVNEAAAAGAPTVSSPFAGAVNDLVLEGETGYIVDLDENLWVERLKEVLTNESNWQKLSENVAEKVKEYNFIDAGNEVHKACNYVSS